MRKGLIGGMIGVLGLAAPSGLLAGMSTAATSVAPAVSSVGGTVMPGIVHVPLLGKHVLSLPSFFGLGRTTQVQSSNWAGYADINDPNPYTGAMATWTEPTANCTPTHGGFLGLGATHTAYSSFWVGLDGYSSGSVEQTGTDTDCGSAGQPIYYAWYETYPAASVQLPNPVSPGDTMTALVRFIDPTHYTLTLSDATKGWSVATPGTGSFARSSAEFVAEAPSQCSLIFCSELPLANFGTVTFTKALIADTKTFGNIASFPNAAMTMVSNGQLLATPGPLQNSGASFSVTWNS